MTTTSLNDSFALTSSFQTRKDFVELPPAPVQARVFDGTAMLVLPRVAAAFGFEFRAGTDEQIRSDAAVVVTTALADDGLLPPSDIAWFGDRYDYATTWVVAYLNGIPVGSLGLLDARVASVALDMMQRQPPSGFRPERTRELGRLAILRSHQRSPVLLAGLLNAALRWSVDNDVKHLFAGADARLEGLLRILCPSLQTVRSQPDRSEHPVRDRYFRKARELAGPMQLLSFDVARSTPWRLLWKLLSGGLQRFARPSVAAGRAHLQVVRG